jgi:hypothetical protein
MRHTILLLAILLAPIIGAQAIGAQAKDLSAEERDALAQADADQNKTWAKCTDAQGAVHLVVQVVPQRTPTTFPQILTSPVPQQAGYYDMLLYKDPDGRNHLGVDEGPEQLTSADRQNGIQAKYVVHLFVPAYRIYDPRTGGWGAWSSGSSWEREKVNFVNYTITKVNGMWNTVASYNMITSGQFGRPDCADVPK